MSKKINNDTKNNALGVSRQFLQTLGFNGFSFQAVADELGIQKASLHYYFKSKDELGIALVDSYEAHFDDWVARNSKKNSFELIEGFMLGFIKMSDDCKMICPMGVLSNDFLSLSKKLQKRVLAFHLKQKNWLTVILNKGKKEKIISHKIPTEALTDIILSTLQGGIQISRIRNENRQFKTLIMTLIENCIRV